MNPRSKRRSRAGETNVPALIGLILAIFATVASFVPLCGACAAIPLAGIALLLALIGFATAKKQDSGTGLALCATLASGLAVAISIGWYVFFAWEAKKEQERQAAEAAIVRKMAEEIELEDVHWKVGDAIATPAEEPDRIRLVIRIDVRNQSAIGVVIGEDNFSLSGANGVSASPAQPIDVSVPAGGNTAVEVAFVVPRTASDLVLRIDGTGINDYYRQVKIEPREDAPADLVPPGGGEGEDG